MQHFTKELLLLVLGTDLQAFDPCVEFLRTYSDKDCKWGDDWYRYCSKIPLLHNSAKAYTPLVDWIKTFCLLISNRKMRNNRAY